MPYYIRKLPCSVGLLIEKEQIPNNVALYNPSRSESYTYIRQTNYIASGEENKILLHIERTKEIKQIDSPWEMMPKTVNLFRGIEDLRICEYKNKLWFGGTSTHISDNMNSELVVGYFNDELTRVEKVQMVDIGSRPVKNVVPFVKNDKLLFLDSYLKKIYELKTNDETNEWYVDTIVHLNPGAGISDEKYRGSTSPIHLHGSIYGCVVHDIIFNDNNKLVTRLSYLHHWMEFDINTGLITFISTPFWIAHWGVEYVSGIHKDDDGKISLYLGLQDKLPMKCVTTLHNLRVGK
jgi:hypothetical protein